MTNDNHNEKRAVALHYDGSNAPTITAEGSGELAEQIIAIAREHKVPLFENAQLLALLSEIGLGEEIPETLYLCIAQIIAFAYKIQGKYPENWQENTDSETTDQQQDFLNPDYPALDQN